MKKTTVIGQVVMVCFLLFIHRTAAVQSSDAVWIAGFGQGNLEYFANKNDVELYISCPTKDGSANALSSVSVYENGRQVNAFQLQVGRGTYDGPFEADSRVGDNNFLSLIESLRQYDVTILFNNKKIIIPKSNAADILPSPNLSDFQCNLFFNTDDVGVELNQLLQGLERSKPVSSSADIKDSLVKGVEYVYHDDGSCRAGSNKVCVTSNDFLQLCGQDKTQLSNYAVRTLGLYNSDFRILSQNSVRWKLNFDLNASTPCALYVTASGILRGNSRQITILAIPNGFILNDDGNLFISTLRFMYELN